MMGGQRRRGIGRFYATGAASGRPGSMDDENDDTLPMIPIREEVPPPMEERHSFQTNANGYVGHSYFRNNSHTFLL